MANDVTILLGLELYFCNMKYKKDPYHENIQKWIDDTGKTIDELASEMGIARETLSRLVNGKTEMFSKAIMTFAKHFNRDVVEILTRKENSYILNDASSRDEEIQTLKDDFETRLQKEKLLNREYSEDNHKLNVLVKQLQEALGNKDTIIASNSNTINFLINENLRKDNELIKLREELESYKTRSE